MNTAIFYDTETTGLPNFKARSEAAHQPHIVQLAACLVDLDSRKVISSMDVIVEPESWSIPDEVSAIHGITTEFSLAHGVSESMAVGMFMSLWERAQIRIAHNEQFDARILRIALLRHEGDAMAQRWKDGLAGCTQLLSTPILKLPPTERMIAAGFKKNKSANLREAFEHFTGRPMEGAHNAMVDVQACMAVYFAIEGMERAAA